MKKVFTLFFLCSMFTCFQKTFCQQKIIDSLRSEYSNEKDAAKKLDIYEQIAKEAMELDLNSAVPYADTLESMADKAASKKGKAKALNLRGKILKAKGEMEGAIVFYRQDLALRIQLNDQKGIAQSYNDIGAVYAELYLPDSAIANYLRSVEINEKAGDYSSVASAYGNIGNLYSDQKVHDKAIAYLEKALKIRLEHGEEKKCMYTYNNLTSAYGTSGNIEKAMEYAEKGIAIALKYDNKYVAGVIEGGIGHLLIEKGKHEEAIRHCERSVQLLEEVNRKSNLVFPLVNMASAYNALNKPELALKYALKGYAIMQETKQVDPLEVYYEEIANAYEKMGNSKESLIWFKKFMALDDSLFKAENIKSLADVETKYQTQKKETQIAQQDLALSEQRQELFQQRTWLIALVVGLLALAVLGYLFYNRYRLRQKQILNEALIREQQLGLNAVIEAQETERKRIAKDLHDGIAQELVAMKMGFEQFRDKENSEKYNGLLSSLDDACKEVRNLSHVMSPPMLDNQGLPGSLEMLLRNSLGLAGIQHQFENLGVNERMDEKIELGIYRIAQELINNIIKHAGANKVIVQLQKMGTQLILRIEDNGEGFDFESAKYKGSMGLLNILSRVRTLNGSFVSEPSTPSGTVSMLRVPVKG